MLQHTFVRPKNGSLEDGDLATNNQGEPFLYPLVIARMQYRYWGLSERGFVIAEISQNGKLLTQVDP